MAVIKSVNTEPLLSREVRSYIIYLSECLLVGFMWWSRFSIAVISDVLEKELDTNASGIGVMSSVYYATYVSAMLPSGLLYEVYSPEALIAFAACLCSLASLLFAVSDSLGLAIISRLLIGLCSSPILVGNFSLITTRFGNADVPNKSGFLMLCGNMMVVLLMTGQGIIYSQWQDWRGCFAFAFVAFLFLGLLIGGVFVYEKAFLEDENGEVHSEQPLGVGEPRPGITRVKTGSITIPTTPATPVTPGPNDPIAVDESVTPQQSQNQTRDLSEAGFGAAADSVTVPLKKESNDEEDKQNDSDETEIQNLKENQNDNEDGKHESEESPPTSDTRVPPRLERRASSLSRIRSISLRKVINDEEGAVLSPAAQAKAAKRAANANKEETLWELALEMRDRTILAAKNPQNYLYGLCLFGMNILIFAGGGLWLTRFLMVKYGYSRAMAAGFTSSSFFSGGLGCFIWGKLAKQYSRRVIFLRVSMSLFILLELVLFLPNDTPSWIVFSLIFIANTGISAPVIFASVRELNWYFDTAEASTAFTNLIGMMAGFVSQLLTGFLLDMHWEMREKDGQSPSRLYEESNDGTHDSDGVRYYSQSDYWSAFWVMHAALACIFITLIFVKETYAQNVIYSNSDISNGQ